MNETITIRRSTATDSDAVERVAALDSGRPPEGDALVAVVAGEVQAVLPLACGRALADPFRPTAHLVELLQLAARDRHPSRDACVPSRRDLRRPVRLVPRAT